MNDTPQRGTMPRLVMRRLKLILLCLVLAVCSQQLFRFMVSAIDEAHYARQRLEVINQLGELRLSLEQHLNTAFYVSRGLEMLMAGLTADGSELNDHWDDVRRWAREAVADLSYVSSIGVSDGYIIRFAYPRAANKAILGVDYRELPEQWPVVRQAVRNREPVVAGPIELIQGGAGIICRIPLFTDRLRGDGGRFIGIVSMVLDYDELLTLTDLPQLRDELDIAIRGRDGRGVEGEVFLGSASLFGGDNVRQRVEFLGGNWVIAAKPLSGWSYESPYSRALNILGWIVSLSGAVLLYLAVSGLQQRARAARDFTRELESRVYERTQQLSQAKEQAEQANQAKSEFLAVVTHELRTPLNSVIGLTDLMLGMELGSKQRDYLVKVGTSANLLLELINNILSYAKLEAGKDELALEPFSLEELRQKVTDMFEVSATAKGLRFSVHIAPGTPPYVEGDKARLLQVMVNLCGNALKFTREGFVEVGIEAVADREAGESSEQGQQRFRFTVRDSGIGIDRDNQRILFQPFSQVDSSPTRRYPGTGLGLSICKSFVDLMGGDIGVDSAPGQGSLFWFEVPLQVTSELPAPATAPEAVNSEDLVTLARSRLAGARVILAEDNAFNQTLAVALLEKIGVEPEVVVNGREVLERLEQGGVHGVLMDIQMPEMDGVEATRLIRSQSRYEGLPIIALTANAMEEDRRRVLEAGMDYFIAKPIKPDQFYRVLAANLDRRTAYPRSGSDDPDGNTDYS